ncbi:hypothetical protein COCNU_scaffold000853G000010 [Cocos nucifera]|nr:hypothetical protein [Cocos nucifera]
MEEMDAKAAEMLSKGLQARKRKGAASDELATKKAKVNAPSSITPTNVATTTKVAITDEVIPVAKVDAATKGSLPPSSMSPPVEDPTPQPPVRREEGERKKDKRVIMKVLRKEKATEVDHLLKDKAVKVEGLQKILRKEELTSVELQAALDLEEERRKKVEAKVGELKDQASKQISEVKIQAMEEFKDSSKVRDLNVTFGQEAFQKGYELCGDRVAAKFLKLDLSSYTRRSLMKR